MTWRDMTWHDITYDIAWYYITWHYMTLHDNTCQYLTIPDNKWQYLTFQDKTWEYISQYMTWIEMTWLGITGYAVIWHYITFHDMSFMLQQYIPFSFMTKLAREKVKRSYCHPLESFSLVINPLDHLLKLLQQYSKQIHVITTFD